MWLGGSLAGHVSWLQGSDAAGQCGEMKVKGVGIDVETGLQNEGNAG